MADPFLGMIILVPYNFAPRGYAFCNGQLLSIAQNTALFSLLGTTYGGDGQVTFALPDLRGRVPVSSGQGPGLSLYTLGEVAGTETVTLLATEMPAHVHNAGSLTGTSKVKNAAGNSRTPVGALPAVEAAGVTATYSTETLAAEGTMAADAISLSGATAATGSSQPHTNVQPYLTLNYCIALQGIFPSRN